MEASGEVLALRSVGVSLGGRRILTGVDLALGRGAFCGLIGANGSGKTTLLRTILGLVRPSDGEVLIDGGPRRASVGYVPQKSFLDPNLPIRARDVVSLGLDGHRLGIPFRSPGRRRAVDAMLDAVDARGFAEARIGDLSGGQQQRILIAHALVRRPKLLLLDEPLANLDVGSIAAIVSLLRRLATEHGVTVLLSAHDVNPLLRAMDRVVYLAGGRAVSGSPEAVIRTEMLSRLYGQHVDVIRVHGRILVVTGEDTSSPATDVSCASAHATDASCASAHATDASCASAHAEIVP